MTYTKEQLHREGKFWGGRPVRGKPLYAGYTAKCGELRRRSMDLTRALADLRRRP